MSILLYVSKKIITRRDQEIGTVSTALGHITAYYGYCECKQKAKKANIEEVEKYRRNRCLFFWTFLAGDVFISRTLQFPDRIRGTPFLSTYWVAYLGSCRTPSITT